MEGIERIAKIINEVFYENADEWDDPTTCMMQCFWGIAEFFPRRSMIDLAHAIGKNDTSMILEILDFWQEIAAITPESPQNGIQADDWQDCTLDDKYLPEFLERLRSELLG